MWSVETPAEETMWAVSETTVWKAVLRESGGGPQRAERMELVATNRRRRESPPTNTDPRTTCETRT
jgi:hypothetical protein